MEDAGRSGVEERGNGNKSYKRRLPVDEEEQELECHSENVGILEKNKEKESDDPMPHNEKKKKKVGIGSKGMFTFLLPCVIRILWFILHENNLTIKSVLDMKFYRCWFATVVTAASKVCRKADGRNGLDILWENCGLRWQYDTTDPPETVYNSLRSIKVREAKKSSPLPSDAYTKDVISVAWIGSVCDAPGFSYEPTFRLPHPPHDDTIATNQPEEVQRIVAYIRPCSTCWGCSCGATQNLTWKNVRQETTITDVHREKDEALKVCGYQQQVIAEHWDLPSAQLVRQCAEDRKQVSVIKNQVEEMQVALECALDEIDMQKKNLQVLLSREKSKDNLESQLKECIREKQAAETKLKDTVAKNSATDAALAMIGAFRDVCTSCRSCKRKCVGKGLMED